MWSVFLVVFHRVVSLKICVFFITYHQCSYFILSSPLQRVKLKQRFCLIHHCVTSFWLLIRAQWVFAEWKNLWMRYIHVLNSQFSIRIFSPLAKCLSILGSFEKNQILLWSVLSFKKNSSSLNTSFTLLLHCTFFELISWFII